MRCSIFASLLIETFLALKCPQHHDVFGQVSTFVLKIDLRGWNKKQYGKSEPQLMQLEGVKYATAPLTCLIIFAKKGPQQDLIVITVRGGRKRASLWRRLSKRAKRRPRRCQRRTTEIPSAAVEVISWIKHVKLSRKSRQWDSIADYSGRHHGRGVRQTTIYGLRTTAILVWQSLWAIPLSMPSNSWGYGLAFNLAYQPWLRTTMFCASAVHARAVRLLRARNMWS